MRAIDDVPAAAGAHGPPTRLERRRVLVFPGSTEIALEVRAALAHRRDIELHSAGVEGVGHAPFAFRTHDAVPDVRDPGWIDAINGVIGARGIHLIVPAHDDAVLALAENAAAIDALLVTSPVATCRLTRSKRDTYRVLADVVPVPLVHDDHARIDSFPVFAKPDRGQGSTGDRVVRTPGDLAIAEADGSDLVMEMLPGDEHTIDCFSDRDRGLLFAGPRRRIATRAGISMRSAPVDDPDLEELARRIAGRLELHGAWFFQTRRDREGVHRLLEVAPRIAGTMALHRVLGVNLPLLSIYEALRLPVSIRRNHFHAEIDRALVNRYRHNLRYSAVYVDLDDTLVVRGRVEAGLVAFLFQCLNEQRRVVLITRHAGDLDATLRRHRLAGLFDQIVCVAEGQEKADHIVEPDAILIDDSFRERRVAAERLGIATFDCDAIEMLRDDRV